MDFKKTYNGIMTALDSAPDDADIYRDGISLVEMWMEEDHESALPANRVLRQLMSEAMTRAGQERRYNDAEDLRYSVYRSLLSAAPYRFDEYCQALEFDRPVEKRFYLPRRRVMLPVVEALQDLCDDRLDELVLSMPPRVGKTTLMLFYVTWMIGRDSEGSNLYSSYSDFITRAFYNGVLELLTDDITYKWGAIFPTMQIAAKHGDEETVDIGRRKHYPSLTCRSLSGTLNGACDASNMVISDDLIGSIEEALNKERLVSAWSKVDNNLIPRAKEHAKLLWIGTRWSMADPTGRRLDMLMNNEQFRNRRYKVINLPALNSDDESNFDYSYGVGFSTTFYRQRRASFEANNDLPSWYAQYQGEPIERDNTLFEPTDFRTFNGEIPETEVDRTFMVVDPAWGGGDFVAATINKLIGDDIMLVDVVFDKREKEDTQHELAVRAKRWGVTSMQIEANRMTSSYKDGVEKELQKLGHKVTLTTKTAPNSKAKEQRIFEKSPDIRQRFVILDSNKQSKEYKLFMNNVYSFKLTGHNDHDDAPDVMSMTVDFAFRPQVSVAHARKRLF